MNPDCINNPNNKLNKYISEGLLGTQKAIDDPFFSVCIVLMFLFYQAVTGLIIINLDLMRSLPFLLKNFF